MLSNYDDLLTVDELCELLHIGKNSAYRLLENGEIRAMKSGRKWLVSKISVIEYLENKMTGGTRDNEKREQKQ